MGSVPYFHDFIVSEKSVPGDFLVGFWQTLQRGAVNVSPAHAPIEKRLEDSMSVIGLARQSGSRCDGPVEGGDP